MTLVVADITAMTLCECGCGEQVNPLFDRARVLRGERLSYAQIAAELEIRSDYVRMLLRKPPRFVKGHAARTAHWQTLTCPACGKTFKTTRTSGRTFCGSSRYCTPEGRAAHYEEWQRDYDARELEAQRKVKLNLRNEQRRWAQEDRAAERARKRESAKRIKEFRKMRRRGEKLPWELQKQSEPQRSPEQEAELAALVNRQQFELNRADAGWGERPLRSKSADTIFSLDAPVRYTRSTEDPGEEGGAWYDISTKTTSLSAHDEYLELETARDMRSVIGDRGVADIESLDDISLMWLQEKLREAGMSSRAVQRHERARLRNPEPHRGQGAGSPTKQTVNVGSRKKRREKLGKHSRPKQKPRRAWRREKVVYDWKAAA